MTATNEQILGLLEKWFAALKDCTNPETVTALYAPDAVLVPTLWNGPCFGQKAIRNYFEAEFLPARPEGYLINYSISSTGNVAINSGHYVFEINDIKAIEADPTCCSAEGRAKKRVKKNARYTFVYNKIGEEWKIVAHHSSKMPEEHSAEAIRWVKSDCIVA
ncbi:SgcJ/EcaC family oxidoreductase [Methylocystis echinoides]|uniref:SgcJ/EcaC family oxidoreductase n=1 Tax=Methylocystis echinoides TaxID=29468 RepID=UPI0034346500